MQKILQKTKYNQGFSAIALIAIIAAIIIAGGGTYYYFSGSQLSHNTGQSPVSSSDTSPNSQGNDNSNANNTVTSPSSGAWSGNACDYLTQDIVSQYLDNTYAQDKLDPRSGGWACEYSHLTHLNGITTYGNVNFGVGGAASQYPQSDLDNSYNGEISMGGTDVGGIGDKAWLDKKFPTNDTALLYFVKNRRLYTLSVDVGVSHEDNVAKTEAIAKAIVQKLP
jgi:hypothetical protein